LLTAKGSKGYEPALDDDPWDWGMLSSSFASIMVSFLDCGYMQVRAGEDPHHCGLVLEWVYGSIVSTAEKVSCVLLAFTTSS
jgi:hypothetical protein